MAVRMALSVVLLFVLVFDFTLKIKTKARFGKIALFWTRYFMLRFGIILSHY